MWSSQMMLLLKRYVWLPFGLVLAFKISQLLAHSLLNMTYHSSCYWQGSNFIEECPTLLTFQNMKVLELQVLKWVTKALMGIYTIPVSSNLPYIESSCEAHACVGSQYIFTFTVRNFSYSFLLLLFALLSLKYWRPLELPLKGLGQCQLLTGITMSTLQEEGHWKQMK